MWNRDRIRRYLASFNLEDNNLPAWAYKALEILERKGKVERTDELVTTPDGKTRSRYKLLVEREDFEEAFLDAAFEVVLDDLEREGILKKNGQYHRTSNGELQPIYVLVREN